MHAIRCLLCALFLLVPAVAHAQETFAGLRFGQGVAQVKSTLAGRGYAFEKVDEDGDLHFNGTIQDQRAIVFAMMQADGTLGRVQVSLVTADEDAIPVYELVLADLVGKYGVPEKVFDFYEPPFANGDGHEARAIQQGKGHRTAFWETPNIMVSVSRNLTVGVHYEGPAWDAEVARRTRKRTSDF
ncbi:MAG TPA: hypothetical protein VHQ45_15495 [Gemmatimonadaceae bacterium]|nr:hypothetical protein [Gemmatimonadaceae bacterium]